MRSALQGWPLIKEFVNLRSKIFLVAVSIILIVHLSFDFIRILRKNNWGKDDEIMKSHSLALQIIDTITTDSHLSYAFKRPNDFKELSSYYQLRYFLAPSFLSRNHEHDSVLIRQESLNLKRFQKYNTWKKVAIDSSYYLLIK